VKPVDTEDAQIIHVSAGLGHTSAISSEGELYTWGFNVTGQLGVGDKKTRWEPHKVTRDIYG